MQNVIGLSKQHYNKKSKATAICTLYKCTTIQHTTPYTIHMQYTWDSDKRYNF